MVFTSTWMLAGMRIYGCGIVTKLGMLGDTNYGLMKGMMIWAVVYMMPGARDLEELTSAGIVGLVPQVLDKDHRSNIKYSHLY